MTKAERGYLAGIIDGEGCIGIQKSKSGIQLKVGIFNTERSLLEWIQRRFGGTICDRLHQDGNKVEYNYTFYGHRALDMLRTVYPYLVVKRKNAQLAFLYGMTLQPLKSSEKLKPEVLKTRLKYYNLMKFYNKRGVAIAT